MSWLFEGGWKAFYTHHKGQKIYKGGPVRVRRRAINVFIVVISLASCILLPTFLDGHGALRDFTGLPENGRARRKETGWNKREEESLRSTLQNISSGGVGGTEDRRFEIVLNLIVRNEKDTLPLLLDSVRDIVTDYVIVDTGSDDGTPDVARARGIEVHHMPFINFAESRNAAYDIARKVAASEKEYILLMDADQVLKIEDKASFLSCLETGPDVVSLYQRYGGSTYSNMRLVRANVPDIRYIGPVHEYLDVPRWCKHVKVPQEVAWIQDNTQDAPGRIEYYQELLEKELEKDPDSERTIFYLANTYADRQMWDQAIPMYIRRIEKGGWIEEVNYSRHRLVSIYVWWRKDIHKAVAEAEAIRMSGFLRPEPFMDLCQHFRMTGDYAEAARYLVFTQQAARATRDTPPLFYWNMLEPFWLPYEEFMMWPHLHPDKIPAAIAMGRALQAKDGLPDSLRSGITQELDRLLSLSETK